MKMHPVRPDKRHFVLFVAAAGFATLCILYIRKSSATPNIDFSLPNELYLPYKNPLINWKRSSASTSASYLIYDCSKRYSRKCGGWADRLSGMLSVYVMSIITGKHFLINHDNPCQLSNYLMPNEYNWRYNKKTLKGRSKGFSNFFCRYPAMIKSHSVNDLKSAFPEDVNFVQMNWDFTKDFRQIENISKIVPWITQLHISDAYTHFFNFLFQPKRTIINEVEHILKARKREKLACAHIRFGGSETIPGEVHRIDPNEVGEIWDFLLDMQTRNYSIFVATDAEIISSKAKMIFKENLIISSGNITHMDKTKVGNLCGGFRKAIVDFFLLTKCHELIITRSGFGMTAAYLNSVAGNFYCYKKGLFPCSRYKIHKFFPGEMFPPKKFKQHHKNKTA